MDATILELGGNVRGKVAHLDGGSLDEAGERDAQDVAVYTLVDAYGVPIDAQVPLVLRKEEDASEHHDGNKQHGSNNTERKAHGALAGGIGDAVIQDVDDNDGHVVRAACGEGGGDQVVCGLLRGGARHGKGFDLAVGHHAREAVRAENHTVPVGDLD